MSTFTPSPPVRLLLQSLPQRRFRGEGGRGEPESVAVLATASEITGLPRDNFEVHEISKAQFEGLHRR
jgi:hypothetical protein